MLILPAIDLKGGKVVRLLQGRADAVTVYSDDPVAVARRWQYEGASYLHIVDLDGAFEGTPKNFDTVKQILAAIAIGAEVGGGLRTAEDIQRLLDAGAARCVVGTKACESPNAVRDLVERFGKRIAIGVDARDGFVAVKGWTEATKLRAIDFAKQLAKAGVHCIIYTDISTDGMLTGPNLKAMAEMCDAVSCKVIASGGVSSADDVRALRALGKKNLGGVIIGKALYDGKVKLGEIL